MDAAKYSAKIIPFPVQKMPHPNPVGWVRGCSDCGNQHILPYRAGTIRDGREKVCPPCYVEVLREARDDATK